MGESEKDQNAKGSAPKGVESFLHIPVKREDKARWVRTAQRAGKKLADWVIDLLNANSKQ